MKKLRFTNTNGRQEYIEKCKMEQVKEIMKLRLNMSELKSNFKGKYKDTICPACEEKEETTEHVIQCKEYQRLIPHNGNEEDVGVPMEEKMGNLKWLIEAAKRIEEIEEPRKWLI